MAANALGHELCERCGTRLMLVVEPTTLRFEEDAGTDPAHDEYLLERISTLENSLVRLTDKLEKSLELVLHHVRNSFQDQVLVDLLVEMLGEARVINPRKLKKRWRERCERDAKEIEKADRHRELRARILSLYKGAGRENFAALVNEGFERIERAEKTRGLRLLERAAALAPDNPALNFYLGEHFFRTGRKALARHYLERVLAVEAHDERACLLLGLLLGDGEDTARARELLARVGRRGAASFAAHYALGRLSAAEDDWSGALAEFKKALAARPSPEAQYVVALANFNLGRWRTALRHLLKAVEEDDAYAEAFYLLGLVYLNLGEQTDAAEAFEAAHAADPAEPRYRAARRRGRSKRETPAPPSLFGPGKGAKGRLVTGGDRRLAVVLQQDALETAAAR